MTAEQTQDMIDRETAHDDAGQEQAENEAADVAERTHIEAAQAREQRQAEDATRRRQQDMRHSMITFAHFARTAA